MPSVSRGSWFVRQKNGRNLAFSPVFRAEAVSAVSLLFRKFRGRPAVSEIYPLILFIQPLRAQLCSRCMDLHARADFGIVWSWQYSLKQEGRNEIPQ
jgi:hypothetical protein